MRVRLMAPPWITSDITNELEEAVNIIGDGVWSKASIHFYSERDAMIRAGLRSPKGMQRFLNDVLEEKFDERRWEGKAGYFYKKKTWLRITFRHQMSLGSDIVNAMKVCRKEGMELAIILAANKKTLDLISPNDASALVSFEKLQKEIHSLEGVIDIPLLIGELIPMTRASQDISDEIRKKRPRDITVPIYKSQKNSQY